MDAAGNVEAQEAERLRQGIFRTSRLLEHDVERLQEVVRDGAGRARDALRVPRFVMSRPLAACMVAALAGFVVSRRRTRYEQTPRGDRPLGAAPRPSLRELALTVAARAVESVLTRRFRI